MYNTLFTKIENRDFNFTRDEKKEITSLLKGGILIDEEDSYSLNSKYKVGIVRIEKNKAILEDISNEHKNIILDFEHLSGAYDGDFVLAKRVFNPRSKIKADRKSTRLNSSH